MQIEHVAMYVEDLEKTKDFFIKYFDAKAGERYYNQQTEFQSYFLSFDDGARLEIMQKPRVSNLRKELARIGLFMWLFRLEAERKSMNLPGDFRRTDIKSSVDRG